MFKVGNGEYEVNVKDEGEKRMGSLGPLIWLTQRHTYNLKLRHTCD
jgi:hypothetical protein